MNRNFFMVTLLAMVITSCSDKKQEVPQNVVPIVVDWDNITEKFDYSPLVEDSALVVPLETRDDCLIGNIFRLVYQNHKIYVADDLGKAVYVFDETGHLLSKLRAVGNGPKEYLAIEGFAVHNSQLLIYDKMKRKILFYKEDGQFLYEKDASKVWGTDLFCQGDSIYLVNNGSNSPMGYYHLFRMPIAEGKDEAEAMMPFEDYGKAGWFIGNKYCCASKNEALFWLWPYDMLYTVKGGNAYPCYRIDFGNKRLPERYIRGDGRIALETAIRDKYVTGFDWVTQSEHSISFSYSDEKGTIVTIYKKETGEMVSTRQLYNKMLGGLYVTPSKIQIENDYIITYRSVEAWRLEAEYGDIDLDKCEFYSESTKEMFKTFPKMDVESNPVVIIQKLKEEA